MFVMRAHVARRSIRLAAQRPRSAAVGECADGVRAEPVAHRLLQRVVRRVITALIAVGPRNGYIETGFALDLRMRGTLGSAS